MVNQFLTVFSAVLLAGTALFFAFSVAFFLQKRALLRSLRAYFESPDGEKPSQFGEMLDLASMMFANRMIHQFKSSLGGMNSVEAKKEKTEAIQGILGQSPNLAALAQFLPKKYAKSPEILSALLSLLNKKPAGDNGKGTDNPVSSQLYPL